MLSDSLRDRGCPQNGSRSPATGLPYFEGVRASSPGTAEDSSHTHKPYSQQGECSWFGNWEGMYEPDIAEPDVPVIHPGS